MAEFASKVAKAKEIYHAQTERSTEAWSEAMRKANMKDDEAVDPDSEMLDMIGDGTIPSRKTDD